LSKRLGFNTSAGSMLKEHNAAISK